MSAEAFANAVLDHPKMEPVLYEIVLAQQSNEPHEKVLKKVREWMRKKAIAAYGILNDFGSGRFSDPSDKIGIPREAQQNFLRTLFAETHGPFAVGNALNTVVSVFVECYGEESGNT